MQRRKIWLFLLLFTLFAVLSATVVGFMRTRELSARHTSVERRVSSGGIIYELISVGDNRLCLRKITPDGLVTGYYKLPEASGRGLYAAYHIAGLIGEELYLYRYETSGNTSERRSESIVSYNMSTGLSRAAADIPAPGGLDRYDVFYAPDAVGGGVFLGYLEHNSGFLTVIRVDASSGAVSEQFATDTGFPLASFSVTQAGELYALSRDSRVYLLNGKSWMNVFEPEPGETAANMTAGTDSLIYLFLASPESSRMAVSTEGSRQFTTLELDTAGLIKLHPSDAGNWAALDEDYRYVVSSGGERREVDTLRAPFYLLWDGLSLFKVIFFASVAMIVFAVTRGIILRRKLRLVLKLLIITIPIFTLGMLILVSIAEAFVAEATEEGLRESILEYAYDTMEEIDAERFAGIDWDSPFQGGYLPELLSLIERLSQYRLMNVSEGMSDSAHNAFASYWVYRIDGDKVYTAACGHFVTGLEVKYFEYVPENAVRDAMITSRKPVVTYVGGMDSNARWTAVWFPIISGDELVGFLEVARPLTAIDEAVYNVKRQIVMAGLVVFASVITAFVLVLAFSTKTLAKLKRGALAVSGGDYAARVATHSWDETGEIAAAFNKMAGSVEQSIEDITAVSCGYSRFVSDKLIELLGKGSIKEVHPGDHSSLTATHILLYTDSFDKLRDKVFFDALGGFYNAVIPCVASGGGLISHYSARGFTAMFESAPEATLRTMLSIHAALDRLDGSDCYVFMSYSGVMIGVTGNGENLNLITVSRLVYESYAVGMAGKRFGARLIVAEGAYSEMGEAASSYRHRFLGFLRADGEVRRLYEFYDCDAIEIRVKKDEAKERFENGVRMYYAKEYSKARRIFVDIIKEFPEDMASREYLRRSHAGYESGGEPLLLLELE